MSSYSWEQVEALLPGVWDTATVLASREGSPDPDMPSARPEPSHGFERVAQLADVKLAWRRADLTLRERQAALLVHGAGWMHRDAAAVIGVSRVRVTVLAGTVIEKILAHLNGAEPNEMEVEDG